MRKELAVTVTTRSVFTKLVEDLSIEQLNEIPAGFKNNIAWNYGHLVASQQVLCYLRAGLTPLVEEALLQKYQKGSAPQGFIPQEEIDMLKEKMVSLIEKLDEDMDTNAFENYQPVLTSFGVQLNDIHDAIAYSGMHDGLHLGYAMAMRKLL